MQPHHPAKRGEWFSSVHVSLFSFNCLREIKNAFFSRSILALNRNSQNSLLSICSEWQSGKHEAVSLNLNESALQTIPTLRVNAHFLFIGVY